MPAKFTRICVDCGTTTAGRSARCRSCGQLIHHKIRKPIPNPNDPSGETMLIPLTQGKFAIIDAEDAELVSAQQWNARKSLHTWYAQTRIHLPGIPGKRIYLHRFLVNPPEGQDIDHRDLNGLNNRRSNLRFCTDSLNHANCLPRSSTGFKGVKTVLNRWGAYIAVNKKFIWLGTFDTPEEAARAYDARARIEFGEFARCNFQDDDS